jgi:DNA-binding SARP family transcriptional activator
MADTLQERRPGSVTVRAVGAQIALLGPPAVLRDGAAVTFDTRKAIAVLAHLALSDRPRTRESLCEFLWPDQDPDRARGALRRTLSTLRAGIGADGVVVAGETVALGDGLDIDVRRFRALAEADDLEAAVALFRGRFLEGFGVRDSPDFDTWQLAQEAALARELVSVLARLVATLTEAGEHRRALEHAGRWLSLDGLSEPAHRALIRLHALTGERAAALDQYRACVRTLNAELGVAPTEETARLYAAINEGTLSAPDAPPARALGVPPGELPLVGRDAELAELASARRAVGPDGHLILVEGESGIGKTRLIGELAGPRVLTARCHDEESALPYGAVIELLRQAARQPLDAVAPQRLADAGLLAPELANDLPPLRPDAPGAEARLLDAVASVLTAAADAIVVDDVHAADAASVALLTYLGRRLRGRPLLLALSWRSEAVPPGHPLRALARERDVTIVRPRRLTEAEVAALAPDAEQARQVWVESEGLPLFVAEYLAAGDALAGARSLLDARLAGADDVTRQVAGAAAVLGRGFDSDALRDTSGRAEEEVAGALEDLVARGMLREQDAGYEFAHGQLRALVYDDVSLARRRLLHRRAAATGGEPAVVAEHLRRAGDDAAAAEQFVLAAEHAAGLLAHDEAVGHLEAALALGRTDVHERLGDLRTRMGDYPRALAAYETAAASGAAVDHKLGDVHLRRGEWAAAEARFAAALNDAGDGGLRARITADRALTAHRAGDPERAVALAREAGALAADDATARAQAHNLLGMLTGDAAELEASLALAEQLGDRWAQAAALNNLALITEDPDHALALTERALALSAGDRHREAALENNLADLHHAAGRSDEAMAHLRRAVTLFSEVGADEATRLPEIWKLVSW